MVLADDVAGGDVPSSTGCSAVTRLMYFSPKIVFGISCASTFCGMSLIVFGVQRQLMMAPSPLLSIDLTLPTMSPRIFTSEPLSSCSPARWMRIVTGVVVVKSCLNAMMLKVASSADRPSASRRRRGRTAGASGAA